MVTMARAEFHFDFGSPNAYLSHLVIPAIERRTGVAFEYVPVLLGGVFKLTGNRSPAESLAGIRNKPEYQQLETGLRLGGWACSSGMWTRCSVTCGRSRRRWMILMWLGRH
jgi:2-hydroxychromene-2-carboxylate isomerase